MPEYKIITMEGGAKKEEVKEGRRRRGGEEGGGRRGCYHFPITKREHPNK